MPSSDERRKGLRAALPAEFYFNILSEIESFTRGQGAALRRLAAIDSARTPTPKTDTQIFLSRLDQKLSLLIGILAERSSHKSYTHHTVVTDISEFGLAFSSTTLEIESGKILEIGLSLPAASERLMDIAGRVVHVKHQEQDGKTLFVYGVEFVDIQARDQNDIVQWIFSNQREQIRRRRELFGSNMA